MYRDPIDYDNIERRVKTRFQRRYRFFIHTAVFVVGIPLIAQFNSAGFFLIWVALWIFHLIWINYHHHLEQAIDEEIDRERQRAYKEKRDFMEFQESVAHYEDRYHDEYDEYKQP